MAQKPWLPNTESSRPLYFFEVVNGDTIVEKTFMVDRILLIRIVKGWAKVEINGKEFYLTPEYFVFLPPHSNVRAVKLSFDFEAEVVGFMMALQETILQKLGHSFFAYIFRQLVWNLEESSKTSLQAFCILYRDLCARPVDMYSADIANSMFNIFLLSFYQAVKDKYEDSVENNPISSKAISAKFAMLLHQHFKQHHTVSFYAEQLCISSKYLTQILRSTTGFTPKTAIDRTLGTEAVFLLGHTSSNIQEISNMLGFPDQSYFGRFFKRLFGVSPLHFRNNPDLNLLERLHYKVDYEKLPTE